MHGESTWAAPTQYVDGYLVLLSKLLLTTEFVKVWEEVAVPQTPPTGFLIKMLASGGESILLLWLLMTGGAIPQPHLAHLGAFRTFKILPMKG